MAGSCRYGMAGSDAKETDLDRFLRLMDREIAALRVENRRLLKNKRRRLARRRQRR